ncbi:MAG: LysR family transcriptional regulator [Oscillospiraceae bacterium]|jgi:DNA-binding transcriptional LysR family regulator
MTRYDVFVKVVEVGSFTKAAEELGYTQSAVSQMVHTLERELSTTLIHRSRNGIVLTPDGEEYLPYLRAVCNAGKELEEKYREMHGLQNSVIRIGTFTSVSRNLLPRYIKAFKQQYPTVQFVLQQGEYTNICQWIQDGTVDFGFVNPSAISGLHTHAFLQDEMLAVLPPDNALVKQKVVLLEEMDQQPFILLDEGKWSVPIEAFRERGLVPDVQYKVYDDYSIMSMVEQGLGISMLYRIVLAGCSQNVVTRPIYPPITRTISLAWRDKKMLSTASRLFLDCLLEEAGGIEVL